MFGKLNLAFPDLLNAQIAKVSIFIGKIVTVKDLIAGEADKGEETMEARENKTVCKTGFLYCPGCGLRIPKSKMLGYYGTYCPSCGSKMIEEGSLPYKSTSYSNIRTFQKKIRRRNNSGRTNSYNKVNKNTKFDNDIKILHNNQAIEKSTRENYKNAIKELTELIRLNPSDFKLYFDRATLKVHAEDFEEARRDFELCEKCHHNSNYEFEDYPLL
ncbi:hypothetical protein ACFLQ4_02120 [Bacteroidota bacterium]